MGKIGLKLCMVHLSGVTVTCSFGDRGRGHSPPLTMPIRPARSKRCARRAAPFMPSLWRETAGRVRLGCAGQRLRTRERRCGRSRDRSLGAASRQHEAMLHVTQVRSGRWPGPRDRSRQHGRDQERGAAGPYQRLLGARPKKLRYRSVSRIDPNAPIPATSVGVALPMRIEPNAKEIRTVGDTRSWNVACKTYDRSPKAVRPGCLNPVQCPLPKSMPSIRPSKGPTP